MNYKALVINNIINMRMKIGTSAPSYQWLDKKSLNELREEQDTTIEHYNQAIKNMKK
jgi:hypothetical protein